MPDTQSKVTPEQQARIARDHAQRVAALWQRPILPDQEAAEALGLPISTWHLLKRTKDAPPTFSIGRRVYVDVARLRRWLEARAQEQATG